MIPTLGPAAGSPRTLAILGDVVRNEPVLQPRDFVFQHQLPLLQALQLELVERALVGEARDHGVEIAMLAAEFVEAAEQGVPVGQHGSLHIMAVIWQLGHGLVRSLPARVEFGPVRTVSIGYSDPAREPDVPAAMPEPQEGK
jgi:hypothetical protein